MTAGSITEKIKNTNSIKKKKEPTILAKGDIQSCR